MTDENKNSNTLLHIIMGVGITLFIYLFFKDQYKIQLQSNNLSNSLNSNLSNINELKLIELEKELRNLKAQNLTLDKKFNEKPTDELKLTNEQLKHSINKALSSNYHNLINSDSPATMIQLMNDGNQNKIRQMIFNMK